MRLFLTRHGETDFSLNNTVCGSTDCPLTDKGREQARDLADYIKGKGLYIAVIYSSPLVRARETAEIISKAISAPVIVDDRLREQSCGAYEGVTKRDDQEFNRAIKHFANRLQGGDSALQLAQRVYNFLDEICVDGGKSASLIVGHVCVCRMVHTYFNEISNDEYFGYLQGTCTLAEYDMRSGITQA